MSQDKSFRLEVFADPLYGSELFLNVNPELVAEVEDRTKFLLFRPRAPVTFIRFKSGETYTVHGHWAQQIKAAQSS